MSDKERSKIWHRREKNKVKRQKKGYVKHGSEPFDYYLRKIINKLKIRKNYRRNLYSKRRNQKYKIVKEDLD